MKEPSGLHIVALDTELYEFMTGILRSYVRNGLELPELPMANALLVALVNAPHVPKETLGAMKTKLVPTQHGVALETAAEDFDSL